MLRRRNAPYLIAAAAFVILLLASIALLADLNAAPDAWTRRAQTAPAPDPAHPAAPENLHRFVMHNPAGDPWDRLQLELAQLRSEHAGIRGHPAISPAMRRAATEWRALASVTGLDTSVGIIAQENRREAATEPSLDLIVGVLSARSHFSRRLAIRQTWGQWADKSRVKVQFVIGAACDVAPEMRADSLSCVAETIPTPEWGVPVYAHRITRTSLGNTAATGSVGLDFSTNEWVLLLRLGAFDHAGDGFHGDVKVSLYNQQTREKVSEHIFSAESPGELLNGYRYADVNPVMIPKHFKGTVVASYSSPMDLIHAEGYKVGAMDDGGGILVFRGTSRFGRGFEGYPENEERHFNQSFQYAAGTFSVKIDDMQPASIFVLDWKPGQTYPVVDMTAGDVLRFKWKEPVSLDEVTHGAFLTCELREIGLRGVGADDVVMAWKGVASTDGVLTVDVPMHTATDRFFISRHGCKDGHKMHIKVKRRESFQNIFAERRAKRNNWQMQWQEKLAQEADLLAKEQASFGDLLVLDTVDTYRALPRKLLGFYLWASSQPAHFTLKTDDDCFVNLPRVLSGLEKLRGRARIWWSQFRTNWAVERTGKWAELDYQSAVYPPFACGSGNVLSMDLVTWLAANQETLKPFQGEDVSVGIWLSAVHPFRVQDYAWQCFDSCREDMLASPQHNESTLRAMWTNATRCGNPCACV